MRDSYIENAKTDSVATKSMSGILYFNLIDNFQI